MKSQNISRTLLQSTIVLAFLSTYIQASPLGALARVIHLAERNPGTDSLNKPASPQKRQCANPCGFYGQVCCSSGQSCITDSKGQAQCAAGGVAAQQTGAGTWQVYTSTWIETGAVTKTSVYSSWVPAATGGAQCNFAAQESLCNGICCKSGEYCSNSGTCVAAGNGGYTTAGVVGTIPARPTTISGVIVTQTVSPTTTMAYQTPVTTGGVNGTVGAQHSGLSGGAIAGIVIGVLLGLALLWLIIFCLCLDACLTCLGIRKKKRSRGSRTSIIEEEEYVHHHRHAGGAAGGRAWVGGSRRSRSSSDRHSRHSRPAPKKKTGWLGALAAGAATAAAFSMFNKKKKKNQSEKSSSGWSGSSGSRSDGTWSSSDSRDSRSRGHPSRPPGSARYTSRTRSVRH